MLKDIPDFVAISFLDDGVIHSAEVKDHIRNVRTVLAAYRDAGLKLAVKKCNFFADKITYLGHVLNEKGIRPIDSYVDAIKKWPLPRYKRGPSLASPATTASTSPTTPRVHMLKNNNTHLFPSCTKPLLFCDTEDQRKFMTPINKPLI